MFSKVNISIDDITPHPHSSDEVLIRCYELIEIFPEIKFTLFIPMAYYRTLAIPPKSICEKPMQLDLYPDFCKSLLNLSDKNFELGYHGLLHGIPNESNNDEFRDLNYDSTILKLNSMVEIAKRAGLYEKIKLILRPPAWRMSAEAIKASRDFGIEILALNNDPIYLPFYGNEKNKKNDIVYANCYPPFKELTLTDRTEIVYHACDWDRNYLTKQLQLSLIDFLKCSENYEFCFMREMI